MGFSFDKGLVGGRINIQFQGGANKSIGKLVSNSSTHKVNVQAYSKDSLWGKFKVLIGQAANFTDAKGNEYILNMRSLGKALQLTEGQKLSKINFLTKMTAFKRFFPEKTEKTLKNVEEAFTKSDLRKKNRDLYGKSPVLNPELKRIIEGNFSDVKDGDVLRVNVFFDAKRRMCLGELIDNHGHLAKNRKGFEAKEERFNTYNFTGHLFFDNGTYHLTLDLSSDRCSDPDQTACYFWPNNNNGDLSPQNLQEERQKVIDLINKK